MKKQAYQVLSQFRIPSFRMNLFRMAVVIFAIFITSSIVSVGAQQGGGDPTLPVPEIKVDSYTAQNHDPAEGVFTIISWTVSTEDQLGYKLEIQEQGSDKKYVAALFAPDAPGVDTATAGGVYKTDAFQPNKKYDIFVTAYTRDGKESVPGAFILDTAPKQVENCSETYVNLAKQRIRDFVMFDWNDICKSQKTASSYKIYENNQLVGEVDESDSFYATSSNPPEGTVWKIEAYGEEPPNANESVIKTCEEVIWKLQKRGNGPGRPESYDECQVQGTWLRTIVKFKEYEDSSGANPGGWLVRMTQGVGNNNIPYFNFVSGRTPIPGLPNEYYFNSYVPCLDEGNNGLGRYGATIDPWNQFPWTCHNTWRQKVAYGPYFYTNRYWMNFDLTVSGGSSIWPVTTTFIY